MFLIELQPSSLVYLTKLMDAPGISVKGEDVMTHAYVRQQLAQPAEASKLVDQWKQKGIEEFTQAHPIPNN